MGVRKVSMIRISAENFRGGRIPPPHLAREILKQRGQGGPIYKVGEGEYAVMREADSWSSVEEKRAALQKSSSFFSRTRSLEGTEGETGEDKRRAFCPFKS